jgi:hypothetical protein
VTVYNIFPNDEYWSQTIDKLVEQVRIGSKYYAKINHNSMAKSQDALKEHGGVHINRTYG